MEWLDALTAKALDRELPARNEALAVLASSDDDLLDVVAAAFRVRQRYFGRRVKLNYLVGTMIEIPRATVVADEIAKDAQFFSFGTNDLTQTTLGMSRDDSGSFLPPNGARRTPNF